MARLIDLFLPPACAACGRAGAVLCDLCRRDLKAPDTGAFVIADAGVVLGDTLTLAVGAFAYGGVVRRALGRLKYAGAARAAEPLAEMAAPALERLTFISGPAVLVPVPVHPARRRERGFNQASLLARHLGRLHQLPVRDLLARTQATERQHRLDRAARLANLRQAISIRPGLRPPPTVIIVDDILTTAATMEACASILRAAGAMEVFGFAIGREV